MSYRFSVCYVYYLLLSESMYVFRQEIDSIFSVSFCNKIEVFAICLD